MQIWLRFLAAEKADIVKAHYFFAAAALLSAGRIAHLLLTWKLESPWARYSIAFVLFGSVSAFWLVTFDWVQGKLDHISETQKRQKHTSRMVFS